MDDFIVRFDLTPWARYIENMYMACGARMISTLVEFIRISAECYAAEIREPCTSELIVESYVFGGMYQVSEELGCAINAGVVSVANVIDSIAATVLPPSAGYTPHLMSYDHNIWTVCYLYKADNVNA